MISRRRNGPFGRTRVTPSAFLLGPATAGTSILIGSLERTSHIGGCRLAEISLKNCLAGRGAAAISIVLDPGAASHLMARLRLSAVLARRKFLLPSCSS